MLEDKLGWKERGPLFFLRGCNNEAVLDFERWAANGTCNSLPLQGEDFSPHLQKIFQRRVKEREIGGKD